MKRAAVFGRAWRAHRRVEEWKYSDLKAALGEAGIGAVRRNGRSAHLPAGVEMFDLSAAQSAGLGEGAFRRRWPAMSMGAASLALSDGGVALRVPKARRSTRR